MTIVDSIDHNEDDSYYFDDRGILTDSDYLNARGNIYPQFAMELRRDGGALRIRQTDVAVIFDPDDPAETYDELLKAVLGLDKEFTEDSELWKFTKRDLRYKLRQIYKRKDKKEEDQKKQQEELQKAKEEETKKETKVRELAEKLEQRYHFAAMQDTGELYYYSRKKGIYEPAEPLVHAQLEKMQPGIITDTVTNVIQKLARRYMHKREDFDADKYIWNMENGLYDIRTNKLKPHTWRYLSKTQLPVKFDPKARSKLFWKFLSEILYRDQIKTAVQLMAFTFWRDNPFELYVILLGGGSNGKSVLMHVLTQMHGKENVSGTSLASLITNRFAKKELEGKNVNIDMEMSKATINDMSVLKELTGVQPVRIEPKHLPAYTTRLWAKLFFSANQMPEMTDFSDGHYRREVILSFPYLFEEVDPRDKRRIAEIEAAMKLGSNLRVADATLRDRLTTPEELSGIFNTLMIHLRTIVLENKPVYVDVKSIEQRRLRHELVSDPIRAFFAQATEPDPDGKMYKDIAYLAYRRFCKEYRLPVEAYDQFCRLVKRKFQYELSEGRDSSEKRRALWKGASLVKWANTDPMQDILTP